MKTIQRIATILIVLALGIETFPRVQAVEFTDDTLTKKIKKTTTKSFKGYRIYPGQVDQLLSNESVEPSANWVEESNESNVLEQQNPDSKPLSYNQQESTMPGEHSYYSLTPTTSKCEHYRQTLNN